MGRITETVKVLLIANVIFFAGTLLLGEQAYNYLALYFFKNEGFQVWQLITHMFMHGGFLHILFNMYVLYMFGSQLEASIGNKKFIFLYLSAGFGAVALQFFVQYLQFYPGYEALIKVGSTADEIRLFYETSQFRSSALDLVDIEALVKTREVYYSTMVGASGAIAGVMAAFAVSFPDWKLMIIPIPVPIKAKYLILGYFAIDVFSGLRGTPLFGPPNVANWAHVGGGIIGFIMMYYWKKNGLNQNRWN